MPGEFASIVGEPVDVPCQTPKGRSVKVQAERLFLQSVNGEEMEARLSGGATRAAEQLRMLAEAQGGG